MADNAALGRQVPRRGTYCLPFSPLLLTHIRMPNIRRATNIAVMMLVMLTLLGPHGLQRCSDGRPSVNSRHI
jgi:hypothetical protein